MTFLFYLKESFFLFRLFFCFLFRVHLFLSWFHFFFLTFSPSLVDWLVFFLTLVESVVDLFSFLSNPFTCKCNITCHRSFVPRRVFLKLAACQGFPASWERPIVFSYSYRFNLPAASWPHGPFYLQDLSNKCKFEYSHSRELHHTDIDYQVMISHANLLSTPRVPWYNLVCRTCLT